ncbi:MAG TPA: urea ABC transporter ATP-binding subunit UrtE [Planctomycetota bacterium]|nr:urea ABC transporter ATP-binding subunit UrtE [Planctomycetota bacterium]
MLLSITNLDFAYGEAQILYNITLDVALGKVSCIMGRNGVGKTTLLRNIMGTLKANAGTMLFAGKDIIKMPPHERAKMGISIVPQGRDIFPKLTVEENLRIGLEARTDGVKKIPQEIFELFPVLHEMRRRMGGDLSGGQQQQLAIGRALAGNPGLLLLDEPTEGIQPNIIKQIGAVLKKLSQRGDIAIVLVEQYLDFVKEFGDSFSIMNRGRIVFGGTIDKLSDHVVKEHLSV